MARGDPQIAIRLPLDLKRFIKAEAKANGSSQNSEIVRAIRERMDRKKASTGEGLANTAPADARSTQNPVGGHSDG